MNAPDDKRRSVKTALMSRGYQAAIAALALLLVTGGSAWYLLRSSSAWDVPISQDSPQPGQLYVCVQLTPGKQFSGQEFRPGTGGIFAIDAERSTRQKISEVIAPSVRLAPGGARWAYCLANGGIWVAGTDGTKEELPLLRGLAVWSPDGEHLAISSQKPGSQDARETWLAEVDSGKRTKLPVPETDAVEDWSLDGKWFLTVSSRPPANGQSCQIYLLRTDGTDPHRVTDGAGLNFSPRFSPDGNRIVYVRHEHKKNGLWVVRLDGTDRRMLLETEQDIQACWSPDGKRLAVREQSVPPKESPRVEIVDADGGNRRRLDLPAALWMGGIDWR